MVTAASAQLLPVSWCDGCSEAGTPVLRPGLNHGRDWTWLTWASPRISAPRQCSGSTAVVGWLAATRPSRRSFAPVTRCGVPLEHCWWLQGSPGCSPAFTPGSLSTALLCRADHLPVAAMARSGRDNVLSPREATSVRVDAGPSSPGLCRLLLIQDSAASLDRPHVHAGWSLVAFQTPPCLRVVRCWSRPRAFRFARW
jgi:hypothetical protein